ncbi:unnamed protein product [Vitrella brassicaformis CCMP3155]|uniref:Palmitoyltransferase n=1 Tax=Vitrella brassicaformis (strain CCMP3155) TaxID=1169540 RepID=A0A0G4ET08_VITBC|nr:unnamed protein product [Vitrella brassicaformis CCMP3155]|eukprot:CEM01020.1 unnamed protein product [Vitrella brassicaformis CCMP3155]
MFVLSEWKDGTLIVIGPDWPYTVGLLAFILLVGGAFCFHVAPQLSSLWFRMGSYACVLSTLVSFACVSLKDPGIIRPSHSDWSDVSSTDDVQLTVGVQEDCDSDSNTPSTRRSTEAAADERELPDLEQRYREAGPSVIGRATGSDTPPSPPRRRHVQAHLMCEVCGVLVPPEALHCVDCQVCIDKFDHHCPWTSKCIGRKNITDFYVFLVCAFGTVIYLTICMGVYIRNTSVIHT